jgi:hypothetical protein
MTPSTLAAPSNDDDVRSWFVSLIESAASRGMGDVYLEVRPSAGRSQLKVWQRPGAGLDGYAALQAYEVPQALSDAGAETSDTILRLIGLDVGSDQVQAAERQVQVGGGAIDVHLMHSPSPEGGRLALCLRPAH